MQWTQQGRSWWSYGNCTHIQTHRSTLSFWLKVGDVQDKQGQPEEHTVLFCTLKQKRDEEEHVKGIMYCRCELQFCLRHNREWVDNLPHSCNGWHSPGFFRTRVWPSSQRGTSGRLQFTRSHTLNDKNKLLLPPYLVHCKWGTCLFCLVIIKVSFKF